jgi:hypothetical protein
MNTSYPKTLKKLRSTLISGIILLPFMNICVYAQKLPAVQTESVRAPEHIKIDGKTTEWNDKFKAYNHATDIFYTIANDDENLYLIVHASDPDVLTKITNRGLVFSITSPEKKNDGNLVSITYPVFELAYGNKPFIQFTNAGMLRTQRVAMEQNPDSVSKVANKKLHDNEKFLRTSGIEGVDTLLSIYNRDGIKTAEAFDSHMFYTYELSVPLKYIPTGKAPKFAYHIILPGVDIDRDFAPKITKGANGSLSMTSAPGAVAIQGSHLPIVTATTDFWGDYTLAKK